MANKQVAPYGSWQSPITSDMIVSGTIGVGEAQVDGEEIYFVEARPQEGGRNVVVRRTQEGRLEDVTPAPYNVRTRVHEYGGGAYTVAYGVVYFSHFADQRLYRVDGAGEPTPITPSALLRYADLVVDPVRKRIICVREDHTGKGEAVNTVAAIDAHGVEGQRILASGSDFYSSPRLSPDGARLAWLCWNHPNMPWDGTELWVGDVAADGAIENKRQIAGGKAESIFQPAWSPDGVLYFVSDRSGWWNLYREQNGRIEAILPMEAEFGLPQWVFGMSTYGFASAQDLYCTYLEHGRSRLGCVNTVTLQNETLEVPYTHIDGLKVTHAFVLFLAGSATQPSALARFDLSQRTVTVVRKTAELSVNQGYLSAPETIEFLTEGGLAAHGFFYAPYNADFQAPAAERPPLIVISHGGPTAASSTAFSLSIQYWTSRGFGVLDVNYGGSTGYGRTYRQRLNGNWGVVDVEDCTNGALYLVKRGAADGGRLAIRGGSAGGYTTLCALTFKDVFQAGASYFGVSDCEALAKETHKFESRYMDSMIGPYPEKRDVYIARSPIHFADRLHCPVIFFQGLDDEIVLPNQAEVMVEALRAKGVPVAYVAFAGEGHGFRRAENIKKTLDSELYFYSKIFGFALAEDIDPVQIDNLT